VEAQECRSAKKELCFLVQCTYEVGVFFIIPWPLTSAVCGLSDCCLPETVPTRLRSYNPHGNKKPMHKEISLADGLNGIEGLHAIENVHTCSILEEIELRGGE
jgi:hypothetical protein